MAQKSVVTRQRSASSVSAALGTFSPAIHAKLNELAAPHVAPGEAAPDWQVALALLARVLDRSAANVRDADDRHEAELADDDAPRAARDAAVSALTATVTELREVVTGLFGAPALKLVNLTGPTPREPIALSRFVHNVVEGLGAAKLPAPRVKGAEFDAKRYAKTLRQHVTALDAAAADVTREAREAQVTQSAKTAAIASHDALFAGVANVAEGLLTLVGENDLARRLRPSARRPGVTADDESDDGEDPPAGPKDDAPTG
ncbi:MAG: hypothetical protein U0324_17570 [Polyangiales bacterium]